MYKCWITRLLTLSTLGRHALAMVYQGNVSTFNVLQHSNVTGNSEVTAVYSSCVCYDKKGRVMNTGTQCVSTLINYMLLAMASAAEGQNVATASSDPGMIQEYSPVAAQRRGIHNESIFLHSIKTALAKLSSPLQATHVTNSNIVQRDTLATQMNIYGKDSALLVHTNGTRTSVSFEDAKFLHGRDLLPTNHDYFVFHGVNGIKMEAQDINGTLTPAYVSDLQSFATRFTSDPGDRPTFRTRDSWDYQVCDASRGPLVYGRIIAEEKGFGHEFETLRPIGCAGPGQKNNEH